MTPPLSDWTEIGKRNAEEILQTDVYKNLTIEDLDILLTEKLAEEGKTHRFEKGHKKIIDTLTDEKEIKEFGLNFIKTKTGIDVPQMNKNFYLLEKSNDAISTSKNKLWVDCFQASIIKEMIENWKIKEESFLTLKELCDLIELFPGKDWETKSINYEKLFWLKEVGIYDPSNTTTQKNGLAEGIICVPQFTIIWGIKFKNFSVGTMGQGRIIQENAVPVILSKNIE